MMRSFLISLSKAAWARRMITNLGFARSLARRFVAGETIQEGIQVVRELNQRGIQASLDHLGENTTQVEEAVQASQEILSALEEIQRSGVRANVSIKLSQIGLGVDEEVCFANLERILTLARRYQNFVRIDMEDASFTDRTLETYARFRDLGFDNLGVVIQAYLYRSEEDIQRLGARQARVRLCKGAYQESAQIAYPKKSDVDANYDCLAERLMQIAHETTAAGLSEDGRTPPLPAFATHDLQRINHIRATIQRLGLPADRIEFQMLYGIRRDLQEELVRQGYPVRIYVPYGTHWYPYFMRRLAERPANLWFFLVNFFRR